MPQGVEYVRIGKPPVDKIWKYGAEEFSTTADEDMERAEFWLENTIRVLDELSCTPEECLKCVTEFKKYISQRFLDKKKKKFLELKQGNMIVSEYERFVRLSIYARECISAEVAMRKRFEEGLNEDIKLLGGIMELKEFVVLADRAHPPPSVVSVGSVGSTKPRCKHCNKFHFGDCRMRSGACFRCGSIDHYLKDCPKRLEKDTVQTSRPSNPGLRGRPPRHLGNVNGSKCNTPHPYSMPKYGFGALPDLQHI
ncbi:E3 ubiquitin-protein ligase RBBP6 [Gossypium australe]|uniref:E3 ubiquitin-protein ligase RBBP6 n=1 Tax=Gossypium australe TaxID=47621 RepID=A0A5B6WI15_9ROSI|nr:E3 ubiquitin-protein ligase RBBP6 [Gossypium australe]